ncbi:MAG TPA: S1C family serine protease, partial [Ramlibacter sp.]|nr:S1C family serine protease [Ramlibacter sp.]
SRLLFTVCLVFGTLSPSLAATNDSGTQSALESLKRANAAVVGLDVTAIPDARSAQTLGAKRSGSGVVIGADGLILTIGYLIVEADTIYVTTQDQKVWPARVVGYDQATGLGLVRSVMPLPGLTPVRLGTVAQLAVGEPLMVSIGGDDPDVAVTYLASKRPFSGSWEYHIDEALFTIPAVVNHSGAALFNQRGELLGIGSLLVADVLGKAPRMPGNMFVPIDLLKPILEEMQATGSTRQSHRPWLGVTSAQDEGHVFILRVAQGSPAQDSGIRRGDVVLAVDGQPVDSLASFYKRIWAHARADDEIRITVQRGLELRTLTVRGVDRMTTMKKPSWI